ncbi:OmpA family protein [Algibacter pacificus]|uniref:OmpA family protein n=1 Tax=Algibacter pacificus TaxID=2599389 RepID=UPI0011CB864E|nr:OmpA family protein [Algibacter pacificus]
MVKNKLLLLIVLCFAGTSLFGQNKSVADRYFKEYSYIKSARLYSAIVKRGDSTQNTLERLADSYYNNADIDQAKVWYAILLKKYESSVDSEYYFKYAQTLKSSGEKELSDTWFDKYKSVTKDEVRSKYLQDDLNVHETDYTIYKNIRNLGINTKYSDFNGFVHKNRLAVFSTRPGEGSKIYKWNQQPFLNAYSGAIGDENQVGELELFKGDVNSEYHEATLAITKDGKTMYFTRDNFKKKFLGKSKDNTTHLKLYKAVWDNGKWKNVIELPFNSEEYSVGHPTLSSDEKTLYFASDMPGSLGGTDIFKVAIKGNDKYGIPENLGEVVNTEGMEMFPYISNDNILYFSSNGRPGLGLLDIYKVDLSNLTVNSVYNLGSTINSVMDDFAFVLNGENSGYFSSNRSGGKGDDDVYTFNLGSTLCLENIAGIVTDIKTNLPIENATVQLMDEEGQVIEVAKTKDDGSYEFLEKPCSSKFVIRADKADYEGAVGKIELLKENGKTRNLDLQLKPLIIGDQIVIRPIYFDFDKSYIRPDAQYELEDIVTVMENNPEMIIKIESHTDCRGSHAYNRSLSDRRAKSTRDYIYSRGIAKNRIQSAIGYGESQLLNHCDDAHASQCSEEEHQLNRRSYFYILNGPNNVKVSGQEKDNTNN